MVVLNVESGQKNNNNNNPVNIGNNKIYNTTTDSNNKTEEFVPNYFAARQKTRSFTNFSIQAAFKSLRGNKKQATPPTAIKLLTNRQIGEGDDEENGFHNKKNTANTLLISKQAYNNNNSTNTTTSTIFDKIFNNNPITTTDQTTIAIHNSSKCKAKSNKQNRKLESTIFKEPNTVAKNVSKPNSNVNSNDHSNRFVRNSAEPKLNFWVNRNDSTTLRTKDSIKLAEVDNSNTNSDASKIKNHFMSPANIIIKRKESLTNHDKNGVSKNEIPIVNNFPDIKYGLNTIDTPEHCDKDMLMKLRQEKLKAEKRQLEDLLHALGVTLTSNESSMELLHPAMITDAFHENHDDFEKTKNELDGEKDKSESKSCPNTPESGRADFSNRRHQSAKNPAFFQSMRERVDRKQPYNKLGHNSPIYSTLKELRPSLGVDGFSLNNTETITSNNNKNNTNPPVQITFNVYKNEYGTTPPQQTPQNTVEKKNEKIYDLNHYLGNVTENDIYSECIKHQAPILGPHNMIKTNGSLPRQRKFGCVMHHPNNNNNKILLTENKVDNSFERDYYLENSNGVDDNGLSRPSNTKTSFVESHISNDTLMSSNLKNSPDKKNNNNNYITFKNYYGKNNQLTASQHNNSIDPGKYINNSNSNKNKNNEAYDVDTKGTSHQTNPKNDLESTPSPENGNSNGNNQQIKIVLALKHKSLQLQALEERTLHQIMLEKTAYEKEQNVEMQALLTKQREIEEYKKVGQAYLESLERQRDEKIQHLTRLKGNISKVKKRLSLVDETGTDDSNTAECQKSQSSKASMDIEEMQNSSIDQQYEELEFLIVEMDSKIEEEKERIKRKITAQAARYSEKCQYVKEKLCNPKTSYIETVNRLEQHVQYLRDEHKRIDMLLEVESQKLINGHNTIHNGEKSLEENQSFFSATTDSALGVSNKELQTSSPQGIDKSEGVNSNGESRSNTESLDSALKDSSESLRKRASQEIQTFWKNLTLASSSHIHSVNGIDKSKTLTNTPPESDVTTNFTDSKINVCTTEDKIEANKVLYEEVTYSQIHKSSTNPKGNDQPFPKETDEKSCHAAKTDPKTKKQSLDLRDKKLITNNYASIDVITNSSSPENTAEMNRKKLAQYEQTLKILESNENGAQLTDREFSSFSSFPSSLNLSSSNKHSSSPPLNPHHEIKSAQKNDSIKNNVLQKSNDCEHNLISNSNNLTSKLMSIPCGHIQCCPASEEIPRLSENYQNNYNYNDILRQMSRNKEYTLPNQNDMPNPMGQSFISHQSKLSQTNSTLPDTQGKQNFIDNNNQNIGNKSEYPYYCYLNKNNVSMVATPCFDRSSFAKHKTDLNSVNSTLKNDMVNRSIYNENNKINYYYAHRPNLNNCNNTYRTMISNLNAEGQYHRYEGYYDQIVYDVLRNSAGNNLNGHTACGNNTATALSNNYQAPVNQTQTLANNNNLNNLREYVYGRVCISPLSTTTTNGEKIFQATMNGNKSKKGKNGASFRLKKTETIIQSLEALGIGNTERYVCLSKTCARGFLHKLNTSFKSWQKRWFVFDMLKQRVTYYLDKTETKAKEIIYFQSIHEAYRDYCSGPSFKPPVLAGFFALKTQERLFYLCAPTKECADLWIEVFNSALNLLASEYHLK